MQNDYHRHYPAAIYDYRGAAENFKMSAKQSPGKQSPGIFLSVFRTFPENSRKAAKQQPQKQLKIKMLLKAFILQFKRLFIYMILYTCNTIKTRL